MWYFNNIGGLEVNREVLSEFLYSLEEEKKLTKFLKIIFKYKVLHDYNYISKELSDFILRFEKEIYSRKK